LLPIVSEEMRVSRIYLAAGLLATTVYYLLPWGSFAQTLVYDGIGVSAAAAAVAGAQLHRPSLRLPWYLFGAGLLAFSVGDVLFNLYAFVWHSDPPVPSIADAFYLAGYPFLTVGLFLLVRCLQARDRRTGRIDAGMLVAAFALCQWVFLMADRVDTGSLGERLVAFSYPAMDILLLAALVFFALTPVWRTISYRYLAASIVLLIVADEVYGFSPQRYASASWLDSCWLLSYVLWGVAALHPSMRQLSEPARSEGPRLSTVRFAMLASALATAPTVLALQWITRSHVDVLAIAVGSGSLSGLVLLRLASVIRALDRVRMTERLARAEAETAQRLLTEQNERLREADRLKDEFVALVSHDLRTPLTSIMGYLELAREEPQTPELERYLEVVGRNAERLLRQVNDLLFVAQLQAGRLALEPEDVELDDIVRDAVALLQPRADAKSIELTTSVEHVPPVHVDRGRIQQVLDNLVANALKFTPDAGTVHVSLRRDGDVVRLEVTDTGIGIGAEDQKKLFSRFFRAQSAVQRQLPGTGLGLYISRVVAEAHQGALSVDSTLGRGSTFRLELPLVAAAVRA
jgi:signal transduction histidine kinase